MLAVDTRHAGIPDTNQPRISKSKCVKEIVKPRTSPDVSLARLTDQLFIWPYSGHSPHPLSEPFKLYKCGNSSAMYPKYLTTIWFIKGTHL